jgi:diguanylate cyclase (GGDEF)-like protein
MKDKIIIYCGSDPHFKSTLATIADDIGATLISSACYFSDAIDFTPSLALLISEPDSKKSRHRDVYFTLPSSNVLVVLALSGSDIVHETTLDISFKYDQLLIKDSEISTMTHNIRFYFDYLSNTPVPENHGAHEATEALNNQVSTLQQQIDQFNHNLKLHELVIKKINQISDLSKQINCLNLKQITQVCIQKIPELISARFASLYSYNPTTETLRLLRHNHPYDIEPYIHITTQPDTPMAVAIRQKRTLLIKDFSRWNKNSDTDQITRPYERNYVSNSCIITPLLSGGKIIGLLNLADKIDTTTFDHDSDMPPVKLLCEIIGSAMHNISLYEEVRHRARTDSMTGLTNHATFYQVLSKEVARATRYHNELSLVMIDIDNLKGINDTYGHIAGDQMLNFVSDQIKLCTRESDTASRYGGDEFAIILTNTSLTDAMHVANRLLDMVSAHPIELSPATFVSISISIGISQYKNNLTPELFMHEADNALFQAKNCGKNQLHISETIA